MKKGTNRSGLWSIGFGAIGATLKVLEDNGVTVEMFTRLRCHPDFAERVAAFMALGNQDGIIHHESARAILGKNFFGVEEWMILYGVNFTNKQLREIADFPWGEDVLNAQCPFVEGKMIKDTHFAFLGLESIKGQPLTIKRFHDLHPSTGQIRFSGRGGLNFKNRGFFTKRTCRFRWYLMPLEIIINNDDTFLHSDQLFDTLPSEYENAFAVEEVTKHILYCRKNDIRLNPDRYGLCKDEISSQPTRTIYIGLFDQDGVHISEGVWKEVDHPYKTGLAISRRLPK